MGGRGTSSGSGAGAPASPGRYKAAFERAFPAGSKYSAFVTHYTTEELSHMTLLLANDGQTGQAIHDHGDGRIEATALFNTDGKGEGIALLNRAIMEDGVNYLECYAPYLPQAYAKLGFAETGRYPFDPKQAAADWNYQDFGTPDYVTMALRR